jgi:hypothetical protein
MIEMWVSSEERSYLGESGGIHPRQCSTTWPPETAQADPYLVLLSVCQAVAGVSKGGPEILPSKGDSRQPATNLQGTRQLCFKAELQYQKINLKRMNPQGWKWLTGMLPHTRNARVFRKQAKSAQFSFIVRKPRENLLIVNKASAFLRPLLRLMKL